MSPENKPSPADSHQPPASPSSPDRSPPPASKSRSPDAKNQSPVDRIQSQALESSLIESLRTCYDPEIPVNIYDLGLIYDVAVDSAGRADIKMTLTSPACPVAGSLPGEVENKIRAVPGVTEAKVEVVWDPPWSPDKMSEAARLQLNI